MINNHFTYSIILIRQLYGLCVVMNALVILGANIYGD